MAVAPTYRSIGTIQLKNSYLVHLNTRYMTHKFFNTNTEENSRAKDNPDETTAPPLPFNVF